MIVGGEKMSTDSYSTWWRDHAAEFGAFVMDTSLKTTSAWESVLRRGREDLEMAVQATGMRRGKELRLIDLGCGLGRMSFALADHFGAVLGVDISPGLIEKARAVNDRSNVQFEITTGLDLRTIAGGEDTWDTMFCCEVLHHVCPTVLEGYIGDAFALLRPGGQFVFQINLRRNPLKARLMVSVRRALYLCGKKMWHGYPTGPGFQRIYYSKGYLTKQLADAGFRVDRINDEDLAQTWILATKPSNQEGHR